MKLLSSLAALALTAVGAQAQIVMDLNPDSGWLGFMNVFELDQNGGAYVFGSTWGPEALTATFAGSTLTLGPNSVDDPAPFWYVGGGGPGAPGNKKMDASMYVEVTGTLSGETVAFRGNVVSNTLVSPYISYAFIKDFAADYSSFFETRVELTEGEFLISLTIIDDPTRHVQYGFQTIGPNVWVTDREPIGTVIIEPVPEPSSLGVLMGALVPLLGLRRIRGQRPEA